MLCAMLCVPCSVPRSEPCSEPRVAFRPPPLSLSARARSTQLRPLYLALSRVRQSARAHSLRARAARHARGAGGADLA
eukprot:3477301-Prymnesium_polylepis.1